jgi:hypothetical protein
MLVRVARTAKEGGPYLGRYWEGSAERNAKDRETIVVALEALQSLSKNCKTSIRRFDSDRRLSEPQALRASLMEALSAYGKVFWRIPKNWSVFLSWLPAALSPQGASLTILSSCVDGFDYLLYFVPDRSS